MSDEDNAPQPEATLQGQFSAFTLLTVFLKFRDRKRDPMCEILK